MHGHIHDVGEEMLGYAKVAFSGPALLNTRHRERASEISKRRLQELPYSKTEFISVACRVPPVAIR